MRAMIVAAGLGTRLRPLTDLRPKPALPVRGIPLIAYQLALVRHAGVSEVVVNVHHLPEILEEAARRWCPPGLEVRFSHEPELLDTGGGIRRVADFLRESDPCLIVGGDMILDADLPALVARHREQEDRVTLLLRDDVRVATFGSVGVAEDGRVRRIGSRHDWGGEARAGIYTWANVVASRAFDSLPDRDAFSHFDHWLAPLLSAGARDIRGEMQQGGVWEPVGTLPEYLHANLHLPQLSYFDPDALARREGTRLEDGLVIGAGATLGAGASLKRVVVWEEERVEAGMRMRDGVFAGGAFHTVQRTGRGQPAGPAPRSERSTER